VYVVVEAGVTVSGFVVAPPGAQENVPPVIEGVAVNVELVPAQTVAGAAAAVTVGIGFTVSVPVPVVVQPDKV